MRGLLLAAALATVGAMVVEEQAGVLIGKDSLASVDVKTKEVLIMKLLNHILQPTVYPDIKEAAKEWSLEDNMDKYTKVDIWKDFIEMAKVCCLPQGEIFVHTNEVQVKEAIKVFRLLYAAKDFDVFIRTAAWLRERINRGIFVYALTAAVFHRDDTRGVILPAPYEIYPYYFVDSNVINTAITMKMTKGVGDPALMDYYGIKKIDDKNTIVIDARKGVRHVLSEDDRIAYFTEDIDLNTYFYYLHMNYPFWMTNDMYDVNKQRRGEVQMYAVQQLLARLRLERLAHKMCDIRMLMWNEPLENGYWPKIRLPTGDEMPARQNNKILVTQLNIKEKLLLDDIEGLIREGILTGSIQLRDGTVINVKKPQDIENLSRYVLGGLTLNHDDAKVYHLTNLFKHVLSYGQYNINKYTYVPTALDMYTTSLRDPLYWRVLKRILEISVLFKNLLPKYTHEELDFPGVKIESISTDKLVTLMDESEIDITNTVYLDQEEMKKMGSDLLFVASQRRLNTQPFKVNIEVTSDKAVDAVVRVFIGPKYDCMGRLLNVNDKRLDMVELDSFLYKLETGKNTIVRNSVEMNGVIQDRPWTRHFLNRDLGSTGAKEPITENWWAKSRLGYPHRLLLPLGLLGGLPLQLFVVLSPVRTDRLSSNLDVNIMKESHNCRWSTCIDTMPLGFPFDRDIDLTRAHTYHNMKFIDIMIYRKDMTTSNLSKNVDISDMVMKRDDLTYLDNDMLVKRSYMHVMMNANNMMQM